MMKNQYAQKINFPTGYKITLTNSFYTG